MKTKKVKNVENNCDDDRLMSNIYSDTDSVFYSSIPLLDDDLASMSDDEIIQSTIEKATEVQKFLNRAYDYYARRMLNIPEGQHRFDIKQELVASRGIWMEAKKRYAQWIVNDEGDPTSELDVKGMDIVRSDFPPAFDSVMEEVVVTILKENDKEKVDSIIMDFEDKLKSFGLEEVANPTGVGSASDYQKPTLGQYKKGAPVYFKAALAYNDLLDYFDLTGEYEKISDDSKIKWVYLHDNPLGLDQVGFTGTDDPLQIREFAEKYADYEKMYEKALKSKLRDIYDAVGWDFPSAGKKQAENFFEF
jgi:DNA polymerase elongation subunit (family B)